MGEMLLWSVNRWRNECSWKNTVSVRSTLPGGKSCTKLGIN